MFDHSQTFAAQKFSGLEILPMLQPGLVPVIFA